jgi:creatinine amidohydrolase/Fe(II)-dependent formamide hydrolase-like protein
VAGLAAAGAVRAVPVGSTEQHGPHLALTDLRAAIGQWWPETGA